MSLWSQCFIVNPSFRSPSPSSTAHPYEAYVKTLNVGGKEGKYFDLPRLGGDKYSESAQF